MTDTTTAPARGERITGPARHEIRRRAAELYAQGCTIHSTARQIGRSYGATRDLLIEAGVQLRGRGPARLRRSAAA
ncbi:helix-turn-helix domain-containing protein [Streptomyces fumanus]|uniref:helix-turn-helix domain-containing protein n=1 Tax=Streptomyces fumanus TaxID=67302 RepID=UPI0033E5D30D